MAVRWSLGSKEESTSDQRSCVKLFFGTFSQDLCEITWALCVLEHFNPDIFSILLKACESA